MASAPALGAGGRKFESCHPDLYCEGVMFESGSRCCWRHASPANSMDGFKPRTLHLVDYGLRISVCGLIRISCQTVLVRDLDTGICDFPALREGREVYLCWRVGEERIEWWHETTVDAWWSAPANGLGACVFMPAGLLTASR